MHLIFDRIINKMSNDNFNDDSILNNSDNVIRLNSSYLEESKNLYINGVYDNLENKNVFLDFMEEQNEIEIEENIKNYKIILNIDEKIDEKEIKKEKESVNKISKPNINFENTNSSTNKKLLNKKEIKTKKNNNNNFRKRKKVLFESIRLFINDRIEKIYNKKIGKGVLKKQLLPLAYIYTQKTGVGFNKDLFEKDLKYIFSLDITKRKKWDSKRNEIIINDLLNEKDEEKKIVLKKLFGIKLYNCIEYLTGVKIVDGLQGLETFYENQLKKEKNNYELNINEFLEDLYTKKARKRELKKDIKIKE